MTRTEVLSRLQTVFDDVFLNPVLVTPQLSAHDVEEWTSVQQISLLLSVEEAFGITFRVGEVEATRDIGDFADLILLRVMERERVRSTAAGDKS